MTFHAFTSLSLRAQLAYVYRQGRYIATRWQEVDEAVRLYQLPNNFFA